MELHRRQIHRHDVDGQARPAPGGGLTAGLAQHPGAKGQDQAALLGDGDEVAGHDQAPLRVAPAHQGLGANDPIGFPRLAQTDLGLVVEDEFLPVEGTL